MLMIELIFIFLKDAVNFEYLLKKLYLSSKIDIIFINLMKSMHSFKIDVPYKLRHILWISFGCYLCMKIEYR